ncbi:MAG: UDP-N-acetylmuramate dehydrogenase [Flavobacteriaceae bacterium]|nr:UDP-N-acetylmuramate dehydrogenase [Flavobacteriaceae bacterium]
MTIAKNISLKAFNTFGLDITAAYYCKIQHKEELKELLLTTPISNILVLGGGSNILFTKDFDGLVIHIQNKGIAVVSESENEVVVEAQAGENWHEFVCWCLEKNYGGIENLSLIPGNVGSSPVQNIGAYGVEVKDVFVQCTAIHIATGKEVVFGKEECMFAYRNSIFKGIVKGQYVIVNVQFRLRKNKHQIKIKYGAIQEELQKMQLQNPTIQDVSNAIIHIRKSKLPDPEELGNGGSFFKNPVVDKATFEKFNTQFPDAPFYSLDNQFYKIPAGWLIEQCGYKGKQIGQTGAHKNQALVLVNYGDANGAEIWKLAQDIQQTVKKQFDIEIEPEINIM